MLRLMIIATIMYVTWVSFLSGNDFLGIAVLWNGSIDYESVAEEVDIIELNETDACLNEYDIKGYSLEDAEMLCRIRRRNE